MIFILWLKSHYRLIVSTLVVILIFILGIVLGKATYNRISDWKTKEKKWLVERKQLQVIIDSLEASHQVWMDSANQQGKLAVISSNEVIKQQSHTNTIFNETSSKISLINTYSDSVGWQIALFTKNCTEYKDSL